MKQMKLVLAMFIALAMATPALAFNVEWHGDLNNRFSYSTQADLSRRVSSDTAEYYSIGGESNFDPTAVNFKKQKDDSGFFAEIKYRTHMVVSDDEQKVKGVIGLEIGGLKYGDTTEGKKLPLDGDQKGQIELRWAYTDIELPFDPASRLSVGLQPVGYNGFLWSDNAAGIKWTRKEGRWGYTLGWWRTDWTPTTGAAADDNQTGEIYSGDVTYKFDNGAVNAFVLWRDQGNDLTAGEKGALDTITVKRDSEIWLGLAGNGTWGNLSAMATGIYLTGDVDSTAGSLDREAYLAHGQLDYKMDKYTFTLGGLYASGDDDPNDDKLENFDHIDISTAILGSVIIFDNYTDDNSFSQACYVFDKGYKILYGGVSYALNPKTKVWGKYFWHNTAEDLSNGSDEIGHEFVAGVSYTIMKGLTADINAGYMIAGDALDGAMSGGDNADDIFRTDARIRFKF